MNTSEYPEYPGPDAIAAPKSEGWPLHVPFGFTVDACCHGPLMGQEPCGPALYFVRVSQDTHAHHWCARCVRLTDKTFIVHVRADLTDALTAEAELAEWDRQHIG